MASIVERGDRLEKKRLKVSLPEVFSHRLTDDFGMLTGLGFSSQ
jgi:hypothetical protein